MDTLSHYTEWNINKVFYFWSLIKVINWEHTSTHVHAHNIHKQTFWSYIIVLILGDWLKIIELEIVIIPFMIKENNDN